MDDRIRHFCQEEYSRILDKHSAGSKGLSQTECEKILMSAGASHMQAKNGAYVYLHHGNHLKMFRRTSQSEYDQILDDFGGKNKIPQKCIKHLESLGFSYGQSKTAVYKYRVNRGLIRKKF